MQASKLAASVDTSTLGSIKNGDERVRKRKMRSDKNSFNEEFMMDRSGFGGPQESTILTQ